MLATMTVFAFPPKESKKKKKNRGKEKELIQVNEIISDTNVRSTPQFLRRCTLQQSR